MYKSITTAVAVLALAGAAMASAQTPANDKAQATSKVVRHAKHAKRMQKHLAKLKARLKITQVQEPAWNDFARAAQTMRSTKHSRMKRQAASLTALEIFDGRARRSRQRALKAQALANAGDQLYGRLSSQQQAVWNKAIAKRHAQRHHHRPRHHGACASH